MINPAISVHSATEDGQAVGRVPELRLTPSSVLGLYAFAAATFMVAAHMAHWYGTTQSALIMFPLVLIFGLAQFYAGAWAFQTRDAVSLAMHGTWGAFWIAYGILEILISSGRVVRRSGAFPELGFWFIAIAVITWAIMLASRKHPGMMSLLTLVAIGATLEAIAELAGLGGLRILAGYFLIASAIVAWYLASGLMMRFENAARSPLEMRPSLNDTQRAA